MPVPVNNEFGPRCPSASKNPSTDQTYEFLSLFVGCPLRNSAPLFVGEVNSLNSAPALWWGICANNMLPLSLREDGGSQPYAGVPEPPSHCTWQQGKKTQPASRQAGSTCTAPQAMHTGKHGLPSSEVRQRPPHLT